MDLEPPGSAEYEAFAGTCAERGGTDRIEKASSVLPVRSGILLVDDEPKIIKNIRRHLKRRSAKCQVLTAESADEALSILAENPFIGVVVTDLRMPVHDGFWLAEHIRDEYPDIHLVALAGYHEMAQERRGFFDRIYFKNCDIKSFIFDIGLMVVA